MRATEQKNDTASGKENAHEVVKPSNEGNGHLAILSDGIPETELAKLLLQAHLHEHDTIRREIELHQQLQWQIASYVLLVLAAVTTLTQFFADTGQIMMYLRERPVTLLLCALVSLSFPVMILSRSFFIATGSAYNRDVLAGKINALLQDNLNGHSKTIQNYSDWENSHLSPPLRGVIRFENFRQIQNRDNQTGFATGFLYVFQLLTVFSLAGYFFLSYLGIRGGTFSEWTGMEQVLTGLFLLSCAAIMVSAFTISRLTFLGKRLNKLSNNTY